MEGLNQVMTIIHSFTDAPNIRKAINKTDTIRFAFPRDHTWVAGRQCTGGTSETHTYPSCFSKYSKIGLLPEATYGNLPVVS